MKNSLVHKPEVNRRKGDGTLFIFQSCHHRRRPHKIGLFLTPLPALFPVVGKVP